MTPPVPEDKKPPGPRRVPTDPQIVDLAPEPVVLAQRRFDRPQVRKATMPGLAPVKLPGAPEFPLEHQPTKPAPPHAGAGPTLRATPEAEQEAVSPESAPQLPLAASVGPDSKDAQIAALRARAEAAERDKAELERQQRVRTESLRPGPYQAPIERGPAPAPAPAPTTESGPDVEPVKYRHSRAALRLAVAGFLTAVAIPLAGWITVMRDSEVSRTKSERADVKSDVAKTTADEAKSRAGTNAKQATELEAEFRQYRSNMRELMRLQGVDVPAHEGDPEPEDLKPFTPLCQPGKVCAGPQLILTRPL